MKFEQINDPFSKYRMCGQLKFLETFYAVPFICKVGHYNIIVVL